MEQFNKYAKYYDAIYQGKDYAGETSFLEKIFTRYAPKKVKTILSLGCGTGTYERLLTHDGFTVSGVDRSNEMLAIARKLAEQEGLDIHFRCGDTRTVRMARTYDTVTALFNLIGYQNTNDDVDQFFKTASVHLKKGGLFVCDGWYLPAVLRDRPQNRAKTVSLGNSHKVTRTTTQTLSIERCILDITFTLKETHKHTIVRHTIERHPMRFFTIPELEHCLTLHKLKLVRMCVFPQLDKDISENNWDFCLIAQKV